MNSGEARAEVKATIDNEACSDQEDAFPTVATSPRERRPQTLNARCLQLSRNPPNTNQSKESQARTGSPLDTNYNRRHEIATPSDDAVVQEEDLKIAASKSAFRDRIHPFNPKSI